MRLVRRDATWTLGAMLGSVGLSLLTGVLAARIFGPEGRGALAAVTTLPLMVAAVGVLGMPDAVIYGTASGRPRGQVLGSAIFLALAGSLIGGIILWLLTPYALAAQEEHIVTAARWHIALVLPAATTGVLVSALRGMGFHVDWNVLRLAPQVAWTLVLLVAWAMPGIGAVSAALIFLALRIVTAIPEAFFSLRRVGERLCVRRGEIRTLATYGGPLTLATLPSLLTGRIDQALLAAFVPAQELGLYAVAATWSSAFLPLASVAGWLLFPRLAAMSLEERSRRLPFLMRQMMAATLAASVIAVLATPQFLPLVFGEEYRSAVPFAVLLSVAAWPLMFGQFATDAAKGVNATQLTLPPQLLGFLVTVIGLLLLVPPLGVMGAVWTSLVAYFATTVLLVRGISRSLGCSMRHLITPAPWAFLEQVRDRLRDRQ